MDHADQFRAAIAAAGLTPPDKIIAGSFQRFSTNGKPRDDAGWYIFHDDERPAGRFGCNRSGVDATWRADVQREFTPAERQAWAQRMRDLEAQREAERKRATEQAAEKAARMWDAARPADEAHHPYLERKRVPGIGARLLRDQLLVPLRQGPGKLCGLQIIQPDGSRKFLTGTPAQGAYTVLGKPSRTGVVVICEGYVTGVSIHLATGYCVVVAFSSGNLQHVVDKIRAAMPEAQVIIAGDDDAFTVRPPNHPQAGQPWNPGLEAASATGLPVAIPRWVDQAARGKGTDFNDLAGTEGLDAVRMCFEDPRPILPAGPIDGGGSPTDQPESVGPGGQANNTGSIEAGVTPLPAGDAVTHEQGPAGDDPVLHGEPAGPGDAPHLIFASRPLDTAELFHASRPGGDRILHWRGEFYTWDTCRYVVRDPVMIQKWLYRFMASCNTLKDTKGKTVEVPFHPKSSHVNDVAHALRAVTFTPAPDIGTWLDPLPEDHPGGEIIAFQNGFVHWPTRTVMPATDRLLVTSALEFDYNPSAGPPAAWLEFLQAIWPDDQESIACLAEIMGYLLTDDTGQQKIFMLIGPPRCGKGTILRVIEALVGKSNRASPTLSSLGGDFGLQSLIGKKVAMISDARLSGKADQQVVIENLLRISGEDAVDINRKNLPALTGVTLRTRIVMATNELPGFSDASAAIANRFIPLRFVTSFLGREDLGLTHRLLQELPGILLWALDGLDRLRTRGHFTVPASAQEVRDDLIDQTSPIQAFVTDCCVLGDGQACDRDDLYAEWKRWCGKQGRDHVGTKVHFGRQLSAAFPGIKRAQPRVSGTGSSEVGTGSARLNLYTGVRLKHSFESDGEPF